LVDDASGVDRRSSALVLTREMLTGTNHQSRSGGKGEHTPMAATDRLRLDRLLRLRSAIDLTQRPRATCRASLLATLFLPFRGSRYFAQTSGWLGIGDTVESIGDSGVEWW
jgi:hypothetical protein